MQGLFKPVPELIIVHEQKLVVVFQEVIPPSTPKPVDFPDARRTGKSVHIASVLTVLSYFEICKSLGFRHEDRVDVAVICAEGGLSFNRTVFNAAFYHSKNAPEFRGEHASDNEAAIMEALCQLHRVGVHRITCRKQRLASGTLWRLRERLILIVRRGKEQDKAG